MLQKIFQVLFNDRKIYWFFSTATVTLFNKRLNLLLSLCYILLNVFNCSLGAEKPDFIDQGFYLRSKGGNTSLNLMVVLNDRFIAFIPDDLDSSQQLVNPFVVVSNLTDKVCNGLLKLLFGDAEVVTTLVAMICRVVLAGSSARGAAEQWFLAT